MMKESKFQSEIKKTFEHYKIWCKKFPDSIRTQETRFIPEKPADLIAASTNWSTLIECKLIKKIGRININFFKNTKEKKNKTLIEECHQVKSLKEFKETTDNPAFYFINVRIPRKINVLIIFEIDEFLAIFKNKEYISKEELQGYIELAIPGKKGLFTNDLFLGFLSYIEELKKIKKT